MAGASAVPQPAASVVSRCLSCCWRSFIGLSSPFISPNGLALVKDIFLLAHNPRRADSAPWTEVGQARGANRGVFRAHFGITGLTAVDLAAVALREGAIRDVGLAGGTEGGR